MRDAGACRGACGAGDAARGLLEAVDAGSAPQTCRGPLPLRTLGGVAYRGRMRQSVSPRIVGIFARRRDPLSNGIEGAPTAHLRCLCGIRGADVGPGRYATPSPIR
jgi:hypothetical protein